MARTAVVLFNLGGPDGPAAVRPFLFNLFNDPAIIALPAPLRWLLARFVSARRAPVARKIYAELGGGSPLLANTEAQAAALETVLNATRGADETWRVFIAMRYWHPMSDEAARAVAAFGPDRVVLLPLYPQYSTTTSASSTKAWTLAAARAGVEAQTTAVCCYPTESGFLDEVAALLGDALDEFAGKPAPRVLFSAHGLPKRIVESGDPYQIQVEWSAAAAVARLAPRGQLDWRVCYQSRVGPLQWIGPATDAEIERAGREGRSLIVVPIAFVSEHSETLVELDIEYAKLAEASGVPVYRRVATVGAGVRFIDGLAGLARRAAACSRRVCSQEGARLCPETARRCPNTFGT